MNLIDYTYHLIIAIWSLFFGQKANLTVSKSVSDNIFIYYFLGPTIDDYIVLNLEDGLSLSQQPRFDTSKPTHFFYHGWGENATVGSSAVVNKALLEAGICNVVSFDYSRLTQSNLIPTNYIISVYNASYVGQAIGEYFKQYIGNNQPIDLIRMASHSLGSQIMAKAARTFGIGRLPRLTGLDPAGPYYNIIGVPHLVAADGKFVDVIHTDGGFFGDGRSIGTVDFFPNKGTRVQPGCNDVITNFLSFCSHMRSYQYYAESILHPQGFLAKTCRRTFQFNYCCCNDTIIATMGYYVSTNVRGTYYLKTNSSSPYGLGTAGLKFK